MIYNNLYKVSGSLGGWARENCYAETLPEAHTRASQFRSDYDFMKVGFWRKKPVTGAFVSILHLPSRVYKFRYSQVESGMWLLDESPYTDPPFRIRVGNLR